MTRLLVTLTLLASSLAASGCTDDCQRLADLACQQLGPDSDGCQRAREQADRANADDKRACHLALQVADELTEQR